VYEDGLSHTLAALDQQLQRFIYISTTGVYGQANGEWVDEASRCEPTRLGGKACLTAEQRLHESQLADKSIVLRLSGIYGPERVPNLRALQAGQPIIAPSGSYLNLIHVDDATKAVVAAAARGDVPATYVVSDNQPVLRQDYYCELARLSGVDPASIEFVGNASQLAGARTISERAQRKVGSKRVRSDHIMQALDLRWSYPSYQAGLVAILAAQHG
jgi:nucleoside-diphosphate-sugar epimerase